MLSRGVTVLLLISGTATGADDWARHARRLSGLSDEAHRTAITALRRMRGLDDRLIAALDGPQKAPALDALVALGKTKLVPKLLAAAEADRDGTVVVALGSLLTNENKQAVADAFGRHLARATTEPVPPLAQLAMLDTLARLDAELPEALLEKLLASRSPEVRGGVVAFARSRMRSAKDTRYARIVDIALTSSPSQLRMQAQYAAKELQLPAPKRRFFAALVEAIVAFFTRSPPPLAAPADFLTTSAKPANVCRERYKTLYGDGDFDVRVAFGYKDARPARFVGDSYEKTLLVSYLTAPCFGGTLACGFVRDEDDETSFRKELIGPDRRPRLVRLSVAASAAGSDDDENRTNPFQQWRSRQAEEVFTGGLAAADVVLYDGHSRDGGGPDFAPPKLAWGNHADYLWYARNRPGVRLLDRAGTRCLGLFSCASDRHFVSELRKRHPRLALITSRHALYWADAMRSLLATLNAFLGQWCPADVDAALKAASVGGTIHVSGI